MPNSIFWMLFWLALLAAGVLLVAFAVVILTVHGLLWAGRRVRAAFARLDARLQQHIDAALDVEDPVDEVDDLEALFLLPDYRQPSSAISDSYLNPEDFR